MIVSSELTGFSSKMFDLYQLSETFSAEFVTGDDILLQSDICRMQGNELLGQNVYNSK